MPDLVQVSYLRDEDAEEVCFARGLRRAGAQVLLEAAAGDDLGDQLAQRAIYTYIYTYIHTCMHACIHTYITYMPFKTAQML